MNLILAALKSDTYMLDVTVLDGRGKTPVVMQQLFMGLGGNQVLDGTLTEIPVKKPRKQSASQQSLQEGFQYIRDNGPRCNNQNQMTEWCELHIVEGSGSIIEGWSRDLVMSSLRNYASGSMTATSLSDYPLTLRDLRQWVLDEVIVPFLRFAPEHGLILQGQTGIGKTPMARALSMALSQFYITAESLDMEPSIRSCACLDMLRTEPGVKHKPVIYDDGPLDSNKASDVKSMMDVQEEEVLIWARWGSIKLVKAQHRCIITNPLGEKPDVGLLDRTISHEAFAQLVTPAFVMGMPEQDFLAICKRAFHVVFLKDRAYIRAPSEQKLPVRQFEYPLGVADLLQDDAKPALGQYKRGEQPDSQKITANRLWSMMLVRKCLAGEPVVEFITENRDIDINFQPPPIQQPLTDENKVIDNKELKMQPGGVSSSSSTTIVPRQDVGNTTAKDEVKKEQLEPAAKRPKSFSGKWQQPLRLSQSITGVIDIDDFSPTDDKTAIDPIDMQLLELAVDKVEAGEDDDVITEESD